MFLCFVFLSPINLIRGNHTTSVMLPNWNFRSWSANNFSFASVCVCVFVVCTIRSDPNRHLSVVYADMWRRHAHAWPCSSVLARERQECHRTSWNESSLIRKKKWSPTLTEFMGKCTNINCWISFINTQWAAFFSLLYCIYSAIVDVNILLSKKKSPRVSGFLLLMWGTHSGGDNPDNTSRDPLITYPWSTI